VGVGVGEGEGEEEVGVGGEEGVGDDSTTGVDAAIGVSRAITPEPVVGVDAAIGVPDEVGDGSVAEFEQAAVANKATKIATTAMQSLTVRRPQGNCRLCILLSGDILECVYKYTVARGDHRCANNNVHSPAGSEQSGDLGRMLLPAQAPVNYTRWLNTLLRPIAAGRFQPPLR
jgi:hypothetical protein